MEASDPLEPAEPTSTARRIVGRAIAGLRFVGRQLAVSDQNPHEGKLRGSAMPEKFMNIPDHPPVDDNSI